MNGEYEVLFTRSLSVWRVEKKSETEQTENHIEKSLEKSPILHSLTLCVCVCEYVLAGVRRNFSAICIVDAISTFLPSVSFFPNKKKNVYPAQTIVQSLAAKPFN